MALIKQLQYEMREWQRKEFADTTLEQATLGLAEETGECAKVVLKSGQAHRGVNLDMLGPELADVFIYMTHVASKAGIDLEEAIIQKWDKVEQRSRKKDDEERKHYAN